MRLEKKKYEGKTISFLKGKAALPIIQCFIEGISTEQRNKVINSVVSKKNKELLYRWKIKIADAILAAKKKENAPILPMPAAVSVSFFFCAPFHVNRHFDADNFLKPVIDGLAKGLFCKNWKQEKTKAEAKSIKVHFNENDSVFKWIYFERYDTTKESKEGVYVTVWTSE